MKRSFTVTIYENQNSCFKKEMKLKNQAYEKETQLWAYLAKDWNKVLFGKMERKHCEWKQEKYIWGLSEKALNASLRNFDCHLGIKRRNCKFLNKRMRGEAHVIGPCQAPIPKFNNCLRWLAYTTWKQMILWGRSLWILFPLLDKLNYILLLPAGYCWTAWNSAQTWYLNMK